jgi:ADP-heptose:LPS heptosyltransferase
MVKSFLNDSLNVTVADSAMSCPEYSSDDILKQRLLEKLETACGNAVSEKDLIVTINPSAGKFLPIRAWPASHYVKLAEMILNKTDAYVCIVGTPEEIGENNKVSSQLNQYDKFFDFSGKTASIRELLELFLISDVLVTSDGGPAHFACMTDIAIIAMFGPETPLLYGPLSENSRTFQAPLHCSPCLSAFNHRGSECKNNICMESIGPEEIFDAVLEFIEKK